MVFSEVHFSVDSAPLSLNEPDSFVEGSSVTHANRGLPGLLQGSTYVPSLLDSLEEQFRLIQAGANTKIRI